MKKLTKKSDVKKSPGIIYTKEQFTKDQASSRKAQPIFEAWGL